ncbi:MAG TPA: AAA family ATPase [Vicinamibacterales bacterium]|nr:AAA family ATPase [Vicinamibacterales bacterium]
MQPPDLLKSSPDPLYETFYGLKEQPFAISTDPKFLFLSAPHRRAYDELMGGLTRDESLLLLTGETGSGKTTLCRGIIGALGERTFSSVLHQPYMTGPEMLRLILRDFGLVSREDLRRGKLAGADVPHLMEVLEGFLRSLASLQSRAVVVIDEAQSLSPTLLDEVRMLTAFEKDGRRLIQILLCGQPMLLNTLKTEPMYALNERITRRVALTPLSPAEVESYIYHRLAIAGSADAVSFQPEAMKLVAELSRGLPRRINVLCDRTLQEGRAVSATVISTELVKRAAKSLAGAHPPPAEGGEPSDVVIEEGATIAIGGSRQRSRLGGVIGAAAAGLLLLAGLGYWYFAGRILDGAANFAMPPRANVPTIAPGAPLPIPTDAELEAYFREMARGTGGGGGGLTQLPDDRDQLH